MYTFTYGKHVLKFFHFAVIDVQLFHISTHQNVIFNIGRYLVFEKL